ncbi:hypothetical protein CHELA40_50831 [Chelatococcus asaccharovorans]|nr:hypothetical protein CHELA17_20796 [Chelatococcus asaccharovorans]CAH1694461.1 hypothetical protein CHELA40_50831 [Chelatococcus asaccharovorans]
MASAFRATRALRLRFHSCHACQADAVPWLFCPCARHAKGQCRYMHTLVVLLRHLHPPDTGLGANVGVKRTTSKLLVLVELLNLTFDLEPDVRRDSNVKFAPLD